MKVITGLKKDFKWVIDIEVEITPWERDVAIPRDNPVVTKKGKLNYIKRFKPQKTDVCQQELGYHYLNFMADRELKRIPKDIKLTFAWSAWLIKPDRGLRSGDMDNYYKNITDAANKILYHDDGQIRGWGEGDIYFEAKKSRLIITIENRDKIKP